MVFQGKISVRRERVLPAPQQFPTREKPSHLSLLSFDKHQNTQKFTVHNCSFSKSKNGCEFEKLEVSQMFSLCCNRTGLPRSLSPHLLHLPSNTGLHRLFCGNCGTHDHRPLQFLFLLQLLLLLLSLCCWNPRPFDRPSSFLFSNSEQRKTQSSVKKKISSSY